MEIQIKIIGWILLMLAISHVFFPKYFNWKKDLADLSTINRQMMQVHTFFIALTVALLGVLCITSASDLIETSLGKKISFGIGLFWGIRLIFQFFVYSPKLWKGRTFETFIHVIFSALWLYLTYVFLTNSVSN